jgi:hypothetical protein
MGRKLQLRYKAPEKRKASIRQASEVIMTDPMDEETGVPSTWGLMIEEMVLKGKMNFRGEFLTEWREK